MALRDYIKKGYTHIVDATALYYWGKMYYPFVYLKRLYKHKCFFVWDYGTSHKKLHSSTYKKNRVMDEKKKEFFKDYNSVIKFVNYIVPSLYYKHYEADEIIASLIFVLKEENPTEKIVIHTLDSDMYQLVSDDIVVYDYRKKKVITKRNFKRVVGIDLSLYILYKILVGDKSDNIQGILTKKEFFDLVEKQDEQIFDNKIVENIGTFFKNFYLVYLFPVPEIIEYLYAKLKTWQPDVSTLKSIVVRDRIMDLKRIVFEFDNFW